MAKSTVGVVLATYNGEQIIEEQMDSILGQTLEPDLIVVVDDGSSDETCKIVRAYADCHNNIRFYENEENLGYIRNFEKGILLCDADYLALCDQDDVWVPDKIETCYQKLHPVKNGGLCYHNAQLMYEDGTKLDTTLWEMSDWSFPLSKKDVQKNVTDHRGALPGFSLFFHRNLRKNILPIPGKRFCGHDWWIFVVSFFLYNPVHISRPLTYYRMHGKQASGACSCLLENTTYEIKKNLFDTKRIKKNVKREFYRLFHMRSIKQKKREEEIALKKEMSEALSALVRIIEEEAAKREVVGRGEMVNELLSMRENWIGPDE